MNTHACWNTHTHGGTVPGSSTSDPWLSHCDIMSATPGICGNEEDFYPLMSGIPAEFKHNTNTQHKHTAQSHSRTQTHNTNTQQNTNTQHKHSHTHKYKSHSSHMLYFSGWKWKYTVSILYLKALPPPPDSPSLFFTLSWAEPLGACVHSVRQSR